MHLFVSDLHLGRPGGDDRADGAALAALLAAHPDARALCIVGDLFDAWIEHRHLVPRPPARLFGALAAWTDAGRRLVVFAGNHDPWHRTYLRDELGAEVVFDGRVETVAGDGNDPVRRVYAFHGDGLTPGRLYPRIRRLLRHPLPVALYRTLLPADAGLALARRVAEAIRHDGPEPGDTSALVRAAATRLADASDPVDAVVYGHSHVPDLRRLPVQSGRAGESEVSGESGLKGAGRGGLYANAGAWYRDRTFVAAGADGLRLARWREGGRAETAAEAPW